MVVPVGDDDSALVVDAHSSRAVKIVCLLADRAELEQERAIDQRQYLQPMIEGISDDDSMSIMIDCNAIREVELSRLRSSLAADREQERQIDRRHEHQSIVGRVGNNDAMMMLVDRNASRTRELEIS